jgi:hypothetical protein
LKFTTHNDLYNRKWSENGLKIDLEAYPFKKINGRSQVWVLEQAVECLPTMSRRSYSAMGAHATIVVLLSIAQTCSGGSTGSV